MASLNGSIVSAMVAVLAIATRLYAQADASSPFTFTATIDSVFWPRPTDSVIAHASMYAGDSTFMINVHDRKGDRWELLWISVPRVRAEGSYGNYGTPDGWNAIFRVYHYEPGVPNREIRVCGVNQESVGGMRVSKVDWSTRTIEGTFTFRVPCSEVDEHRTKKSADTSRITFKGRFSGGFRVEAGSRQIVQVAGSRPLHSTSQEALDSISSLISRNTNTAVLRRSCPPDCMSMPKHVRSSR
jgi:hypothetical protein